MPSVLIEVRKQHTATIEVDIMNAVNRALHETFKLLPNDINTRLMVHEPHRFQCPPDKSNPELYTQISISCFAGRTVLTKRALYKAIVKNLNQVGIPVDHIFIMLKELPLENFGIRGGQAASDVFLGMEVEL